jgi:hypothetical protein
MVVSVLVARLPLSFSTPWKTQAHYQSSAM